jgi:hypothetical protein
MTAHDAEFSRQRRSHRGGSVRDPLSAPRLTQREAEPRWQEQLPWPRNLFGNSATIAELMAEAAQFGQEAPVADGLCPCGCRREHRHRVSQTLRNSYGRGYDVIYFSSDACKSKRNRETAGWRERADAPD